MADELNTPNHRWYQGRYHIPLAKQDFSRQWIYASGIAKIDAYIESISDPGVVALGFWNDTYNWADASNWTDGA